MEEVRDLPSRRSRILNIEAKGVLRDFGLSELFSESSEPPFTELPFDEFKACSRGRLPLRGHDHRRPFLESEVAFSHDILDAPTFVQPQDGRTLPADGAVIRWNAVASAVDYEVIVTQDDEEQVLDVTLSPEHTSLTVPPEFLDPGRDTRSRCASGLSGNRIFTEVGFTVGESPRGQAAGTRGSRQPCPCRTRVDRQAQAR